MAEFWSEETLLRLDTVFLSSSITSGQGWPAAASEPPSELCGHRSVHKRGTGSAASTVRRTSSYIYWSPCWCPALHPASCWFLLCVLDFYPMCSLPPSSGDSKNCKSFNHYKWRPWYVSSETNGEAMFYFLCTSTTCLKWNKMLFYSCQN